MSEVFWICLGLGAYPYVLYPVLAALVSRLRSRPVSRAAIAPRVTVAISAYNEARHIEATVLNKLDQDYRADLLDVMVVSDGSTDGTDEILLRLAAQNPRVTYRRQEPRQGKTAALNSLVAAAGGEIVVFADANSMYRLDTVRRLVENFADRSVGYVSGRMVYVHPDGSLVGDGCSAYMRFENWLRAQETRLGSMVGVDGGVDAVRRSLYHPMDADQLPDFVLPLDVVSQGYRVVFEPRALLQEDSLTTAAAEYRMRVRVTLRALWALWDKRILLNPLRHPLFSWQLASHKLLRYLSFIPLAAAAALNWLLLSQGPVYRIAAAGQMLLFALASLAVVSPRLASRLSLASRCYYFLLLNWTSAVAFSRFVRRQKQTVWQPRMG